MSFYSERIFPALCDRVTRKFDPEKKALLSKTFGKTLEIGFGTGSSVPLYPDSVSKLVGLEPSDGMLGLARRFLERPRTSSTEIEVIQGRAEALPFESFTFDSVVSLLTLCTVSDLERALSEVCRVLKPEGMFFFLEHSAERSSTLAGKVQNAIAPAWRKAACGCNINRDCLSALKRHFHFEQFETLQSPGLSNLQNHVFSGIAKKASSSL